MCSDTCIIIIYSRNSDIGAATGRQMASHGLKVLLYMEKQNTNNKSREIGLFKATDNVIVYSVDGRFYKEFISTEYVTLSYVNYFIIELPTPDLVILSTDSNILTSEVRKWLSENR